MGDVYRRVILKPAGLDERRAGQLRDALAAAVGLQKHLAGLSPHILQIIGELQEDADSFFFEHEPARGLDVGDLFQSAGEPIDAQRLTRMAVAVVDALRAAHEYRQPRPAAHGAVCPGVVAVSADGVEKLTDFGIAAALYAALGEDGYKNLAVGPPVGTIPGGETASGVWQVLPAHTFDRDDRICAFIDPEKYGSQSFGSFEPTSDIVSAGILLHLMADRRHPYFHDAPGAHRSVEEAEFMPMGLPTALRRKDLRESREPAVQAFCTLVDDMADRLPENRPSASAAAAALAKAGCRPVDAVERQRRQFESALELLVGPPLHEVDWERVRSSAELMAVQSEAPPEVKRDAEAALALADAVALLEGPEWQKAIEPIEALSTEAGLSAATVRKAQEAGRILSRNREAWAELEEMAGSLAGLESRGPAQALKELAALEEELEELASSAETARAPFIPPVAERIEQLQHRIPDERRDLTGKAQQLLVEARHFLGELQSLLRDGAWERLSERLTEHPEMPRLFDELRPQFKQIEDRLEQHRQELIALQRRRAELNAQLTEAERFFEKQAFQQSRELLAGIEQQDEVPDLAERAYALRVRVDEEEQRFLRRHEEIRQARARADELLGAAESALATGESVPDLQRGEDSALAVLEIADRTEAQTSRASKLCEELRKRIDVLIEEAITITDTFKDAEDDYQRAVECFDRGDFPEARRLAEALRNCAHPTIRRDAERLLTEIESVGEQRRDQLAHRLAEAQAKLDAGDEEAAAELAIPVEWDPYADDGLRERASKLLAEVADARKLVDDARQRAAAEYERAVTALKEGQAHRAREWADAVAANRYAGEQVRSGLQRMLEDLPALEQAETLITEQSYRQALRILDEVLRTAGDGERAPAREAARVMRERARQRLVEVLDKGIRTFLERRARISESGEAGASLEESLSGTVPDWVKQSLTPFEAFLRDCTLTGQPVTQHKVLEPGHHLAGKYEIIEFLGRGGMGEVYKARDLKLKREVALKLARPADDSSALAEALQNEAQAIARLKHAHIFRINSYDVIDGWHCFDTDYIRGRDLAQYVAGRELTPRQIAELLIPIAEALGFAHRQGVLHRDVKPQNIYVGEQPGEGPWLIDFGLAKMRSLCDHRQNVGLCGTPGYIAPEVITSIGEEVDHRADIFGLGCVLYGLLAGQPPFSEGVFTGGGGNGAAGAASSRASRTGAAPTRAGRSRGAQTATPAGEGSSMLAHRFTSGSAISRMLLHTLRAEYVPLARTGRPVPDTLRQICEKAMSSDPRNRQQDASEIAEALRKFLKDLDEQEARSELAKARERFHKRREGEPAELEDLDAAKSLAEAATRHGSDAVKADVDKLLVDIARIRQSIEQARDDGRDQLNAARECVARSRWGAASIAAQKVLANTYVPELHAEARQIENSSAGQLKPFPWKLVAVIALLMLGLGGGGYWWFGVPPATVEISPGNGSLRATDKVTLAGGGPLATLHYTLDGSEPTQASPRYEEPFALQKAGKHSVKARAFKGSRGGEIVTADLVVPLPKPFLQTPGSVKPGEAVTLKVDLPEGARCRWERFSEEHQSWRELSGQTRPELRFPRTSLEDAGQYRVVLMAEGLVPEESNPADLTVIAEVPPTVTLVPKPTLTLTSAPGPNGLRISARLSEPAADNLTVQLKLSTDGQPESAESVYIPIGKGEQDSSRELKGYQTGGEGRRATIVAVEGAGYELGVPAPAISAVYVEQPKPEVDTDPPTVLQVTAKQGVFRAGDQVEVQIKFSEQVSVQGRPELELATKPVRKASYVSGNGTDTLAFHYQVHDGDWADPLNYPADTALAGGRIEDHAAKPNPARLILPSPSARESLAGSGVVVDAVRPQAVAVRAPGGDGPLKAGDVVKLQVEFDEAVEVKGEGKPRLPLKLADRDVMAEYTGGSGSKVLEFAYTVREGDAASGLEPTRLDFPSGVSVIDRAGNSADAMLSESSRAALAGRRVFVDAVNPTASFVEPDPGAAVVSALSRVRVQFSESVKVTAGLLSVGAHAAASAHPDSDGQTFTFTGPWADLKGQVTLRLTEGVEDLAGNRMADSLQLTITIQPPEPGVQPVVVTPPEVKPSGWPEAIKAQRAELEKLLEPWAGSAARELTSEDMKLLDAEIRPRLAKIKWAAPESAATVSVPELRQRVGQLQKRLSERVHGTVVPTRFIEYFWGPRHLHAFCWYGDAQPRVFYYRLGSTEEAPGSVLEKVRKVLETVSPADLESAGQTVVEPIVGQTNFLGGDSSTGSFGVVVAPDGPVGLLPLLDLRFKPLPKEALSVKRFDNSPPARFEDIRQLRELCGSAGETKGSLHYARTGVWTMNSLEASLPGGPGTAAVWGMGASVLEPAMELESTLVSEMASIQSGRVKVGSKPARELLAGTEDIALFKKGTLPAADFYISATLRSWPRGVAPARSRALTAGSGIRVAVFRRSFGRW